LTSATPDENNRGVIEYFQSMATLGNPLGDQSIGSRAIAV
jgi:hypothetical protein